MKINLRMEGDTVIIEYEDGTRREWDKESFREYDKDGTLVLEVIA